MTSRPEPIRLLVDRAQPGARNMAVDEALLRECGAGGSVALRFYAWEPACLSFGRNQLARGAYDPEAVARRGADVVRRPTGGRAVFHARELTYAVAAPADAWGSLREAYCRINRALAAGLRELGVPVACAAGREGGRAPGPDARACFRDPLPGEVVAGGRKLVGSAQWRDGGALLQHGSILLHDDQRSIDGFREVSARDSDPESPTGAACLAEFLDPLPPTPDLVRALATGFTAEFERPMEPADLTPAEADRVERLVSRYSDPAWTWRR